MFPNLGDRYFYGDELHTALMGITTLEYGYPYAVYKGQVMTWGEVFSLIHSTNDHLESTEN